MFSTRVSSRCFHWSLVQATVQLLGWSLFLPASRKLSLSKSISQPSLLLIFPWGRRDLQNLVSFRVLLEPWTCLLSEHKGLPCRMRWSSLSSQAFLGDRRLLSGNCYTTASQGLLELVFSWQFSKQPGTHRSVQDDIWLWLGDPQQGSLLFSREMLPKHDRLMLPVLHLKDLKQPPLKRAPVLLCYLIPWVKPLIICSPPKPTHHPTTASEEPVLISPLSQALPPYQAGVSPLSYNAFTPLTGLKWWRPPSLSSLSWNTQIIFEKTELKRNNR